MEEKKQKKNLEDGKNYWYLTSSEVEIAQSSDSE